ncbi:MAG: Ig-like domain repeat protein [Actinomycetes bacterium]
MRESRLRGIVTSAAAASAVVLSALSFGAAPAMAVTTITGPAVAAPNQLVSYTMTATVDTPLSAGTLRLVDCNTFQNLGTNSYVVTMGATGSFAFAFVTPGFATTMAPCAVLFDLDLGGSTTLAATNLQVSGSFATTTTVNSPDTAKLGVATQIQVTVQSASPSSYNPTGQVVVKDINGAPLKTMGLTPGPGTGQSYAYYWWTPTVAGTYTFQAFYSGDAYAVKSQSPIDTTIATSSGNPISLSLPPSLTVGVPTTLQANVFPATIQGSVGFTLNGAPITASIPIVNGVAQASWTPTFAGTVTIGASYTTNQGGTGSTSQPIPIVAGPVSSDVITLTQPGFGIWAPNGTYNMGTGSSFTFLASTLSGAGVTMKNNGACTNNGLTLTVSTGSGVCTLSVSSPGGNGYGPVTQNYVVNQIPGPQTATVAAPQSGKLTKGRTYVLESPAQADTNAGQNISWKITKGKNSVCKLVYPNSGAVNVKMLKKGTCNVKGSAPGVPNMWNPYTVTRSYTVK